MLTTDQLNKIHLMQKIFVMQPTFKFGVDGALRPTKITKIGTKYFYTEDGRKWEIATGANVTEFQPAELFISDKEYYAAKEMKEMWHKFYNTLGHVAPEGLTLEDVKRIIKVVEGKDDTIGKLRVAAEWGYRSCEKGNNLEHTMMEFDKLHK